jgi:ABC-type Na+ efflux pump permease subunit
MKTLFNRQTRALIRKDLKETLGNRQILLPLLIVPIIFMVVLPVGILIAASFADAMDASEITEMTEMMKLNLSGTSNAQNLIIIFSEYYLPPIFLLIPLMMSSLIGAGCFVIEKEKKTLESIFYCPISISELFRAKVAGTFIPAYILTLAGFIIIGIILNIGGLIFFGHLIYPSLKWILLIFLLCPAILILGLTLIVRTSAKAKSFQEAQQNVVFVVIPVILIVIGQASGIFLLNELLIVGISALVFILDYFLLRSAKRKYSYEKLLQ